MIYLIINQSVIFDTHSSVIGDRLTHVYWNVIRVQCQVKVRTTKFQGYSPTFDFFDEEKEEESAKMYLKEKSLYEYLFSSKQVSLLSDQS